MDELTTGPVLRATGLTKVFGPKESEAMRLARQGVGRAEILRRTGATLAVHDVSFSVERGELFVIMGLSGSGKSTLVRLLNRLIEPTDGTVEVDWRDLRAVGEAELRALRNRKVMVEAADAFGARPRQVLRDVQLPMALPSIMAGVNQVIMLALSMVVVAGLTGAAGLGAVVVRAVTQLDVAAGFDGGLAVVLLAIFLDRFTAALSRPTPPWAGRRRLPRAAVATGESLTPAGVS